MHYYPFGLTMAGISSKAFGKLENKNKFNDATELNTSLDISLYETAHRLYDPQIGRFTQIDGIAEAFDEWSPYTFAFNNPILLNDPTGLGPDTSILPEVVVPGKKLDTENGQVYAPLNWYDYILTGWGREWNGYEVNTKGYLTGRQFIKVNKFEVPDLGSKKSVAKGAAKAASKWLVYRAYKQVNGKLKLYIGKAKNSLSKRYTKTEIKKIMAEALDKLDNIPDNATALGVEQAVLELNGGLQATSNIKNAAVKEIYVKAGLKWLNENIPNWREIFKYQ